MNVLLVAATLSEIKPLTEELGEMRFQEGMYKVSYRHHQIHVLITGVGMTATAYQMGKAVANNTYDMAFNVGMAGSFDPSFLPGTVVHVVSDCFSELGAEDGQQFLSIADLNLVTGAEPVNGENLLNKFPPDNKVLNDLKKVRGITVNTVHGNDSSIAKVKQRCNPQVESMEGAAFFYACLSGQISCAQVRAISNFVEKRNKDAWDIPLAVKKLNQTVLCMLNEFSE